MNKVLAYVFVVVAIFFAVPARAQTTCPTDWNQSGQISVEDMFSFLGDWFAGDGDYNRDGLASTQDIFAFLGDWFDTSTECGVSTPSAEDPFFFSQFAVPAVDGLGGLYGFRTYANDVMVLVESSGAEGVFDVKLWNPDLVGFSGSATVAAHELFLVHVGMNVDTSAGETDAKYLECLCKHGVCPAVPM